MAAKNRGATGLKPEVTQSPALSLRARPGNGSAAAMRFYEKYLPTPQDGTNPQFSVLRAPSLAGLPSATVVTADIDPLRSEGRAYAERLSSSGVSVDYVNHAGVTHEFFGMVAVLDEARAVVARVAANLKTAFAKVAP